MGNTPSKRVDRQLARDHGGDLDHRLPSDQRLRLGAHNVRIGNGQQGGLLVERPDFAESNDYPHWHTDVHTPPKISAGSGNQRPTCHAFAGSASRYARLYPHTPGDRWFVDETY
jgi:hypothetical protein